MKTCTQDVLVKELTEVVELRLLWAVLPSSRALGLQGQRALSEIVTWALAGVREDITKILARHDARGEPQ